MVLRLLQHTTRFVHTARTNPLVPVEIPRRKNSVQSRFRPPITRPERSSKSHDKIGKFIFRASKIAPRSRSDYTAYRRALHQKWKGFDVTSTTKMKCWVQILTTPSADLAGTTLLLYFDSRRYLIGSMGEGTQRAINSAGARMIKVSDCYITGRTEWQNCGGLMGTFLTLADAIAERDNVMEAEAAKRQTDKRLAKEEKRLVQADTDRTLTLFGPPNLNHLLATARRFIFRKGMPLQVHEVDDTVQRPTEPDPWAPYVSDELIKVWAMSIRPTSSSGSRSPASASRTRKRSIDEVNSTPSTEGRSHESWKDTRARSSSFAKDVVQQMFSSNWHLDALHETRLGDVELPATIFYRDTKTRRIEKYEGPVPGQGPTDGIDLDLPVLVRRPWPAALVENLPAAKIAPEAISYIIRNHRQRGKFNPQRAEELKVPSGPKYSQLINGETVKNQDGEDITPEMVIGEGKEGGGFAVVDLPDTTYIDALLARPEWRQPAVMVGVGAIIWTCGPGVANDPRIHKFMMENQALEHIVSSPDYCANSLNFDKIATLTMKLRQIDPDRHPTLVYSNDAPDKAPKLLPPKVRVAQKGLKIQLEPTVEIIDSEVLSPSDSFVASKPNHRVVESATERARASVSVQQANFDAWAAGLPPGAREAEVIALGTGSALPSTHRNVSATLLRVPGWGNMLLDCGENTVGQIRRMFTTEEANQIFKELRVIWISHMHADHHLGTVSAIKAWYNKVHDGKPLVGETSGISRFSPQTGLAVVSDAEMQQWLHEYADVEDYGYSRIAPLAITPADPVHGPRSELRWFARVLTSGAVSNVLTPSFLNLEDVQAVPVQHCKGARAVSFTFPGGFKVSYSGDCRPSKQFSIIGKGSTLCIHEATFEDELKGEALAKKHSTTSEALAVADAMEAKACLLTHFSQRYGKMPIVEYVNGSDKSDHQTQEPAMLSDMKVQAEEEEESAAEHVESAQPMTESDHPLSTSDRTTVAYKIKTDMKVGIAFDYMRIKIGQFPQLSAYATAISTLFAEEEKQAEIDAAAAKAIADALLAERKKAPRSKVKRSEKAANSQV